MEEANSLWCDALLAAAIDPDKSEESYSTRNSQVNGERGFLWFYMEKLDEEIKQLKKELKDEKYAQAQKDIQLLETQIIQKKALSEALSVVYSSEDITVVDLGVDTGNLDEEIEQLEKKYAQAQKDLQDNAATSCSSVLMAETIVVHKWM